MHHYAWTDVLRHSVELTNLYFKIVLAGWADSNQLCRKYTHDCIRWCTYG